MHFIASVLIFNLINIKTDYIHVCVIFEDVMLAKILLPKMEEKFSPVSRIFSVKMNYNELSFVDFNNL